MVLGPRPREHRAQLEVLKFPGIPTSVRLFEFEWWRGWALGLLCLLPLWYWISTSWYYSNYVTFPADTPLHVAIRTEGCDIFMESTPKGQSWASLSYWKMMGTGSLQLDDETLTVDAQMSARVLTFRCVLRLGIADIEGTHFKNMTLDVKPDHHGMAAAAPSNIAEMISIKLSSFRVKHGIHAHITAAADVSISGVEANRLNVVASGGKLELQDLANYPLKVNKSKITGVANLISVQMHSSDLELTMDKKSFETAVLSSHTTTGDADSGEWKLSAGADKSKHTTKMEISSHDCSTYFLVADHSVMTDSSAVLDTKVSDSMKALRESKKGSFLADGKDRMDKLRKWLKANSDERFVIFMNTVAPHAPAGMLSPEVHRIEVPVMGFDFLWPRRSAVDGALTKEQEKAYSLGVFSALNEEVDFEELKISKAEWIWDPRGPDIYAFQLKRGRKEDGQAFEYWDQQALTLADVALFHLASYITLGVGVVAGFLVCYLIWAIGWPNVELKLRKSNMDKSASYRLAHTDFSSLWTVVASYVFYPKEGVLLRWQKRDLAGAFATLTITARQWPHEWMERVVLEKVDYFRIPTYAAVPNQETLLFASKPPVGTIPEEMYSSEWDQGLWGTWCLRKGGKPLKAGVPMQFQVSGYNGANVLVEKSSWSRATMIRTSRAFCEIPLLLFKAVMNILPEDTFEYFLEMHCLPIEVESPLKIVMSGMKLAVVRDAGYDPAFGLFAGAFESTYGALVEEQRVKIVASTGMDEQTNKDIVYLETYSVELPPDSESAKLRKPFKEVFSNPETSQGVLLTKDFIVLDLDAEQKVYDQTFEIPVPGDLTSMVRIEAVLIKGEGAERRVMTEQTARIDLPWTEFLQMVGHRKGRLSDQLVLRDGMAPCAVLQATCRFVEKNIGMPKPAEYIGHAPKIFANIFPGMHFQYGQVVSLSWDSFHEEFQGQIFDLWLVTAPISPKHVPKALWQKVRTRQQTVAHQIAFDTGNVVFTAAPIQPYFVQTCKCRLDIRHPDPKKHYLKYAVSAEFIIERPISMQDLEMGYVAFCIFNNIPQQPVTRSVMELAGLDIQEREFYVAQNYRAPMPTPPELTLIKTSKTFKEPENLIQNERSLYICDGMPLKLKTMPKVVFKPGDRVALRDNIHKRYGQVVALHNNRGTMDVKFDHAWRATNGLMQGLFEKVEEEKKPSGSGEPASAGAALQQPLLAGEEKEKAKVEITTVQPVRTFLDIPTNVFWKYDAPWQEELLLYYSFMPTIAREGYIQTYLELYGWYRLAKCSVRVEDVIRWMLRAMLYLVQVFTLWSPGLVVFAYMVNHDRVYSHLSPKTFVSDNVNVIYLSDEAVMPTPFVERWNLLDLDGKVGYSYLISYLILVIITTFYCNFLHKVAQRTCLFSTLDGLLQFVTMAHVYLIVVYAVISILWVIMGAMIEPNLIPLAVALLGIMIMIKVNWSNLMTMKNHVVSNLNNLMDIVMHAIVAMFVSGGEASEDWETEGDQRAFAGQLVELVRTAEKDLTKKIMDQIVVDEKPRIVLDIDLWSVGLNNKLRQTAAFIELVSETADKVMCTDFVPADILPKAQELANEEATIAGTLAYDEHTGAALDANVNANLLGKAMAVISEAFIPKAGEITAAEEIMKKEVSDKLKLRPQTAECLIKAFKKALNFHTGEEDAIIKSPYAMSVMFSEIRSKQLFTHFVEHEEGEEKKKTSTMQKFLATLQNKEMDFNYMVSAASVLTELVDWVTIGRTAKEFSTVTLSRNIITRVVDDELNEHIDKSAAFDLMIKVYSLAYKEGEVYTKDVVKLFVDCGIIDEEYAEKPEVKKILNEGVDLQRWYDGSVTVDGIITALKWMFLPSSRAGKKEAQTDIPDPQYLWFGAFKCMLKSLGWQDEEMEPTWLAKRWKELTDETGLFRYRDLSELNMLITTLADEGLWKAVAKSLMFKVKLFGYVGCDYGRDGFEKASKAAKAWQWADWDDLKWVNENVVWPDYVEEAWANNVAKQESAGRSKEAAKTPHFLAVFRIDDFLCDVMYDPAGKDETAPTDKVNGYPSNVLDLQWFKGQDGSIWQELSTGKRKLRGLWHEAVVALFSHLTCVPSDLDLFAQAWKWQAEQTKTQKAFLQLDILKKWLLQEYLPGSLNQCTFDQFKGLVNDMLGLDLPEDKLKSEVFGKCGWVPGDDLGEMRYLTDLGAGLHLWMGYGVWKEAIADMLKQILPRGPVQNKALSILSEEFERMDNRGTGILQPAQVIVLLHKVAHPGLTCDDLSKTITENLNLDIPPRQIHKYYTMLDVNCDGVMQVDEFIPMLRLLMVDYWPHAILENMNLSTWQILGFVTVVIINLALVLIAISLVIKTFTSGKGIASAIQGGFNACALAFGKLQSDASSGFNDSVSAVKKHLVTTLMETITLTLGLSKPVIDKFVALAKESQGGLL